MATPDDKKENARLYAVRAPEGELHFQTFLDIEKAWMHGLVEPDDEIIKVGEAKGVLAKDHPYLTRKTRGAQATPSPKERTGQRLRVMFISVLGVVAFVVWFSRRLSFGVRAGFLAVDLLLLLILLTTLTRVAARKPR
jgi:hypothetical protein